MDFKNYFHLLWLCIILLWAFGIQTLTFNFLDYIHRSRIVEYLFGLKKIFNSAAKQLFSIITSVNKIVR